MKIKTLLFILTFTSALPLSSHARVIADINIPETLSLSDQSTKLILNGAGIRTKFIFDIYIGSLYLEKTVHTAKEAYALHGEKRISMHFLYKEVSKEKLINGWNDGFENNLTSSELTKFKNQINQFNRLFKTVKKGDVINLHYIPTTGTQVSLNSAVFGLVDGDDFFKALLRIWLGDDPADNQLKDAMLDIKTNEE